jgi:dihydrofolate reductase
MRSIVSGFACSLDGYIEGPNGEYDWIIVDKEIDFAEQMKRYDAFLYGRRTYDSVRKMGPNKDKKSQHYVISNSLESVDEGYTLLKGDIATELKKLKAASGKDIAVFGGASLLASLLDLELVDELSIAVIPVLLGKGKPMVDVLKKKVQLELTKTYAYSNGTVQLTYRVPFLPAPLPQ